MATQVSILDISDRFVAQCSPVIGSNYDTCGTVTRATVSHLTADQLDDLFRPGGLFADLDAWFLHSIEMKACGVKRNAIYDWIMANADRTLYKAAVTGIKAVKSESLVQPFIFGRQESVVNRDYWRVIYGFAIPANTTASPATKTTATSPLANDGTVANGTAFNPTSILNEDGTAITYNQNQPNTLGKCWIIRVDNRHNIPLDKNFFRPREVFTLFSRSAGGVLYVTNWKVMASAWIETGTAEHYIDIAVIDQNSGSSAPKDLAPTNTLGGVIVPGINNVNDYEKWCQNQPTIDPRKRVPFWVQTWRDGRCVDSEYRAVYKRLFDTNPAFREFGDLPLAERNRQDEAASQRRFVHSFFYNKPISGNQTVNLWESLETIYTVDTDAASNVLNLGLPKKMISRRANFVGVKEQLRVCDRVFDLTNQPLNFYEWLDLNYNIKRARESQGRTVKDLDWWCSSTFKARIATAMMGYYKAETLEQFRVNAQFGKESPTGWAFDSYEVKRPAGVRINILSDNFFDDLVDEFDAQNMASAGNLLLCLDIGKPGPSGGTIYFAQIAANRKAYTSAQIEELAKIDATFRCVMEYISVEQTLTSQSGTVVVECPLASAWIENFADADPILTGRTTSYTNLY